MRDALVPARDELAPTAEPVLSTRVLLAHNDLQSIYKIAPHPTWAVHGFPANATDGFVGHPKMHELNVGALWKQIWRAALFHAKNKVVARVIPFSVLGFWVKSTGMCAGAMPYRRDFTATTRI